MGKKECGPRSGIIHTTDTIWRYRYNETHRKLEINSSKNLLSVDKHDNNKLIIKTENKTKQINRKCIKIKYQLSRLSRNYIKIRIIKN